MDKAIEITERRIKQLTKKAAHSRYRESIFIDVGNTEAAGREARFSASVDVKINELMLLCKHFKAAAKAEVLA